MSSFITASLCLITLFSFVSCASSSRTVAQESEVKRSPEGDYQNFQYREDAKRQARSKY